METHRSVDVTAGSTAHGQSSAAQLARLRGFHPGWYGAVMGTAIVGIIAYQDPGNVAALADVARAVGVVMVGLAAVLAITLGIPYVARWLRHPAAARADLTNPVAGALYGTFPGGILVLALGIATVGPSVADAGTVAAIVTVLAIVGVALAFLVSLVFAAILFVSHGVEAQAANGGWFIPPVVNIIVPVVLVSLAPQVAAADLSLLVAAGYAFWGMGFVLYLLVASLLYDRLVFHPLPGAPLAPSLWIGLGPVGVGSLALLRVAAAGAPLWGDASSAVSAISAIGATALWGFGLWWLAAAVILLVTYLRRAPLPYGLGWWGFTFPLGAFTAATLALARTWHAGALEAFGVVLFVALLVFWAVVAIRTVLAVASGEAWAR